jgi:hypothetical protein
LDWKPKMADLGLKQHVKILPEDPLFKNSVTIGGEKIAKATPEAVYHKLSIEYANDIDEAMQM